jgi:cell division septation protein DedD
MRCLTSWFTILFLVAIALAVENGKHNAFIDSLKRRTMETPVTADPTTYQDEATYGTFKPLHPPSAEEELDPAHPLKRGWRVRVATYSREDSAKYYLKDIAKKLQLPTQLYFHDNKYDILCGNYAELSEAQTQSTKAFRSGYVRAEPIESWIVAKPPDNTIAADTTRTTSNTCWQVQVAATKTKKSADSLATILRTVTHDTVEVILAVDRVWRVRVGNASTSEEAMKLRDKIRELGYPNAWLTTTEKK